MLTLEVLHYYGILFDVAKATSGRDFEKLTFGRLHEKHAVQREI
jgi:hypothetical protein